ncbi:MAG: hypothetical protein Q9168_007565 [Polycauliona sp. 1 TL-2023]
MAQYRQALEHQFYQARFAPSKMDSSSKIDEGYSEDTRSQDGADSPMRMDSVGDASLQQSWSSTAGVSHQIMSLGEAERSGTIPKAHLASMPQFRV